MVTEAVEDSGSYVCVGLDPDPAHLPEDFKKSGPQGIHDFCVEIIENTKKYAAAYKLNFAFFEAIGRSGWEILSSVRKAIPPNRLTIADAKRGDIGNSAKFYAKAIFDELDFHAATVNPYMGYDAVAPFIERPDKGAFILTLTSNKGAEDFQFIGGEKKLYQIVAEKARIWNELGNIGLVTGATRAGDLRRIRNIVPDLPFLVPGIGAQGGDLETVVENTMLNSAGGALINSSRGIIYASEEEDFAEAAGEAARNLKEQINTLLNYSDTIDQ
ncbi:MAG: orotidine-5'-phosphate decarboxylase [Candidatus Marinimicrobia bacterium]|nr:orotidine-5'-phosphate decarboxylase [Candidatus Neomarinimicrobiota bacterium]